MGSVKNLLVHQAAEGLIVEMKKKNRLQRREGTKRDIEYFTISKIFDEDNSIVIRAMMSGPNFKDMRFEVIKSDVGIELILIAGGGRGLSQAIEIVETEVGLLYKAVLSRPAPGTPINKDNWDGYYMESRNAGPKRLLDLERAIASGIVSADFAKQASEWGFSIYETFPKEKI
ncbi:hypothetical protein BDW_02315 [Bdellovibrio bacteriovorus W]|nr:hypothetical protein BDW_02315 [Bdellovibrio bacteriovorus W]